MTKTCSKLEIYYCCSVAQSCLILWTSCTAACQALLSSTISWSLLRFMSIELVMISNHLILCHSLLLLSSIFPSVRVFSSESVHCEQWKWHADMERDMAGDIFRQLESPQLKYCLCNRDRKTLVIVYIEIFKSFSIGS